MPIGEIMLVSLCTPKMSKYSTLSLSLTDKRRKDGRTDSAILGDTAKIDLSACIGRLIAGRAIK